MANDSIISIMEKLAFIVHLGSDLKENLRVFPVLYYLTKTLNIPVQLHGSSDQSALLDWARENDFHQKIDQETKRVVGLDFSTKMTAPRTFVKASTEGVFAKRTFRSFLAFTRRSVFVKLKERESFLDENVMFVQKVLRRLKIDYSPFVGCPALKTPSLWKKDSKSPKAVIAMSMEDSLQDWNVDSYIQYAKKIFPEFEKSVEFLVDGQGARMRLVALQRSGLDDWGMKVRGAFNSLEDKVAYLDGADHIVSSNTDTLHIAHALGKNIFGVFPHRKIKNFWRVRPHGYWHQGFFRYQIIS